MKILILSNGDSGLIKFRKELIIDLLKISEVYISCPKGDNISALEEMGCHYLEVNLNRHGTNPFSDFKLYIDYKNIIKEVKPNIVLTFTIKPNVYGGMACIKAGIPYVANITGLGNAFEKKGFLKTISLSLYRKGLKKASIVFFQNQENLNFMIDNKIVKENYKVLPGSGVNLKVNSFEKYINEDKKIVFVTVGRVMKEKGIYELLEAAKRVKEKYGDLVTFKLIGPYDGDIKETVEKSVSENIIEYLGYRDDIHELLKNSSATIHPSYHEGTSNVLLETAACGRPILASNVPGCNNTFINGVSGISFEAKNVDSLLLAIEKFISLSYEEKKHMGEEGRKFVEQNFDRNIVVREYIKVIERYSKGS